MLALACREITRLSRSRLTLGVTPHADWRRLERATPARQIPLHVQDGSLEHQRTAGFEGSYLSTTGMQKGSRAKSRDRAAPRRNRVQAAPTSPGHGSGDLIQLLAGSDQMDELLPRLHQRALQAVGGVCAVLLRIDSRSMDLQPSSAFGLDRIATGTWLVTDGESRRARAALRGGDAVAIADLRTSMPTLASRLGTAAALLVPLVQSRQPLGLLVVGRPDGSITAAQRLAIRDVANAFVLALQRERLIRETEIDRDLRRLLESCRSNSSATVALDAELELFCVSANALFGATRTSIWIHDRRAREIFLQASSDPAYTADATRIPASAWLSPAAVALQTKHAGVPPMRPELVKVPLRGRRRAIGELQFEGIRLPSGAEASALERLDEVGRQLSFAIENAQLLDEVLRSHHELEDTFNSIADLVVVADRRFRVVHVNQAFAQRAGVPREQIVDRPLSDFVSADTNRWIAEFHAAAAPAGAEHAVTAQIHDSVLDGTFLITITRLLGQTGEPVGSVMVARDVTGQARLEAEQTELRGRLTQSEKLAALGQFVAGIAHELNNPLQGVLGHLELLRATGVLPKAVRRDMQVVYREADRAARIVRNLLVFAGSRRITRRPLSVNVVLSRALSLRSAACRAAGIEVIRTNEARLPRVSGDPLLLQQALLNIILNAEQALAGAPGGRIELTTTFSEARRQILITVRDTGAGIPADVLPRIFEPFFTTKDVGKGTGLGLAITYGIIQEHGGHIQAGNAPDGGALFTVGLPIE